jgi:hypothetical protein
MHRHFDSTMSASTKKVDAVCKARSDPKKMMKLSPNQFSSSVLSFTIYVAIAFVGIEIFEFSCRNCKLEVIII